MSTWGSGLTARDTSVDLADASKTVFAPDGDGIFWCQYYGRMYYAPLSVDWDVSTSGTTSSITDHTNLANMQSFVFNDDGTVIYFLINNANVKKCTLSTAWDVTTIVYASTYTGLVSGTETASDFGVYNSGSRCIVCRNRHLYQYSLTTPWDFSTLSYDSKHWDYDVDSFAFSSLGDQFVSNENGDHYRINSVSSNFDLGSVTAGDLAYIVADPTWISTSSDDKILLIMTDPSDNYAKTYDMNVIYPLPTTMARAKTCINSFPLLGGV